MQVVHLHVDEAAEVVDGRARLGLHQQAQVRGEELLHSHRYHVQCCYYELERENEFNIGAMVPSGKCSFNATCFIARIKQI